MVGEAETGLKLPATGSPREAHQSHLSHALQHGCADGVIVGIAPGGSLQDQGTQNDGSLRSHPPAEGIPAGLLTAAGRRDGEILQNLAGQPDGEVDPRVFTHSIDAGDGEGLSSTQGVSLRKAGPATTTHQKPALWDVATSALVSGQGHALRVGPAHQPGGDFQIGGSCLR